MKKSGTARGQSAASPGQSASELISKRIADLADWRGETLARMRRLIQEADPEVVEEWKWMGTPIFSHDGIVCTGESYKKVVKLTFAKGAALSDPKKLFNSSLDGNVRRAIDIQEGEVVDEAAFKALFREAVALNQAKPAKLSKSAKAPETAKAAKSIAKATKAAPSAKPGAKGAKSAKPAAKGAKSAAKAATRRPPAKISKPSQPRPAAKVAATTARKAARKTKA